MRSPLIMHEGGPEHIEHMLSRLDSIHDELVSFERVIRSQDSSRINCQWTLRDTVADFLSDAQSGVEDARSHMKRLRKRIKPKRPR